MKATPSNSLRPNPTRSVQKRRAWLRAALLSAALGCAVLPAAAAETANPPKAMTYQGYLTVTSGSTTVPLGSPDPVNRVIDFKIYDKSTGPDTLLWTETQTVTFDEGQFSVVLGEITSGLDQVFSSATATASDRFIEITVKATATEAEKVIAPRLRLVTSPYSFLATSARQVVGSGGATLLESTASGVKVTGQLESTLGFKGSGAELSALDASKITAGTLDDTRLSSRVPKLTTDGYLGIGTESVGFPLSFSSAFGDKISLNGSSSGFGIRSGLLQIHSDLSSTDIAFGWGSSANMTETMRIKGNGSVGIGTNDPTSHRLHVVGGGTSSTEPPPPVAAFSSPGRSAYIQLWDRTGPDNRVEFASREGGRATIWSNGDRLNVLRDGRVGIGTMAPSYPLTVNTTDIPGLEGLSARIRVQYGTKWVDFGRDSNYAYVLLNESEDGGATRAAVFNGVGWRFDSDRKLKKDIVEVEPMLERALKVQVRRYRWKEDAPDATHKLGVIAQEVQPLFPEMVTEVRNPNKPEEKSLSVGYGDFGVIAIKALQEIHKILQNQEARLSSLEERAGKVEALEREVATLKKQLAANQEAGERAESRFQVLESLVKKLASAPSALRTVAANEPAQ